MKRYIAVVLSIAVFVLVIAGGAALMYFSPRGILNPSGPEEAMQNLMLSGEYNWADEFYRSYQPEVTGFEDAEEIKEALYNQLSGGTEFTFREADELSTGKNAVYIISGEQDILAVSLIYENGTWHPEDIYIPENLFTPETYTATVLVPSDSVVFLNDTEVSDAYITEDHVPYGNMTGLELSFPDAPYRVCYTISGLYQRPTVDASRETGLILESSDAMNWIYTTPDAASYSLSALAPADTTVYANGIALGTEHATDHIAYSPLVDVPEELQQHLPEYTLYEVSGLYTQPELTAADSHGNSVIASVGSDGISLFPVSGSSELQTAHNDRVVSFIENLAEYGAGHTNRSNPGAFTVPGSELAQYFLDARASLVWVVNVTVSYDELTTYDYQPLGDNAFLCKANLVCTTTTPYQKVALDLEYEMLWVNQNGSWLVADLAFTDNYSREIIKE